MATTILGLDELTVNTVLAYAVINGNLKVLDGVLNLSIINQTSTTPPVSPSPADAYIPLATATDDWLGKEKNIAIYISGSWRFIAPVEGLKFWDKAQKKFFVYDGTNWVQFGGTLARNKAIEHSDLNIPGGGSVTEQTITFTGFKSKVWRFPTGVTDNVQGNFTLPKHADYENVNLRIFAYGTTTEASKVVRVTVDIYNAEDGEDIDSATSVSETFEISQSFTASEQIVAGPAAVFDLNSSVTELSSMVIKITREGAHANDTYGGNFDLFAVNLQYNEKLVLDADW